MARAQELQKLVRGVADKAESWVGNGPWQAQAGSEAAREFANGEQRFDGTPWGEDPVRTSFALAQMAMIATIEHARAMATLINSSRPAVSQEALTRAALEAASIAWWLLEPGLGARRRVVRLQLLRRNSAGEYEKTLRVLGNASVNISTVGGERVRDVENYSASLGLTRFTKNGRECEGQTRLGYTERVEQLTGTVGFYQIYSGVAHAEVIGLWRLFPNRPRVTGGRRSYHVGADYEATFHAVDGITIALLCPMTRIASLFGWPSPGKADDLDDMIDYVDAEMARFQPTATTAAAT